MVSLPLKLAAWGPKRQVPELDQAMERCVYGESIAADLLSLTGEVNAGGGSLERWC